MDKKRLAPKIMGPKFFWVETYFGAEKDFESEKNFGSRIIYGPIIIFGTTKFWVQNILHPHKFCVKKNVCPKIF